MNPTATRKRRRAWLKLGAFVQSVIPNVSGPPVERQAGPFSEPKRSALNLSAEAFFHEKLAKAKGHFAEIKRLLEVLGEKLDAIEVGQEADIDDEVNQIEEQIFLYNDALESAGEAWLAADMPDVAYNRLAALPRTAALGLPLFSDPEQAKRSNRLRYQINQRLHEHNASMDRLITRMEAVETAGSVAGLFAGGGILVAVGKKGGRWAVAKALAVGVAAIAAEQGAEAGLRRGRGRSNHPRRAFGRGRRVFYTAASQQPRGRRQCDHRSRRPNCPRRFRPSMLLRCHRLARRLLPLTYCGTSF